MRASRIKGVHTKTMVQSGSILCSWTKRHMGALTAAAISIKGKPLEGISIGFCLQLTAETAVLIEAVQGLGAKVIACAGNPHTTQDEIAAYLASRGVEVHAWRGQTAREFHMCCRRVMDATPDILVDDGGELGLLAHTKYSHLNIIGGTEETTTGVNRMRALAQKTSIRYPLIAVNNAKTKSMFDNTYGTGQSALDAIMRACGVMLASKKVVVAGYGPVGRGVASRCAGLGARVIVTEVDPVRALEAHMDGYSVMPMAQAAKQALIFITCTGQRSVITTQHISTMSDGAILANVGHFDLEVDVQGIAHSSKKRRVRPWLDEYTFDSGKRVFVVAKGFVANLVAAHGNPPEIMALSFANQLRCIVHIARNANVMPHGICEVPHEIDERVARDALLASQVSIDG